MTVTETESACDQFWLYLVVINVKVDGRMDGQMKWWIGRGWLGGVGVWWKEGG